MSGRGIEIERRFKMLQAPKELSDTSVLISQWYMNYTGAWNARARITTTPGVPMVSEYEYTMKKGHFEVPIGMTQYEFTILREHCQKIGVHKQRFHLQRDDYLWELDAFRNFDLHGLTIAEVEIPSMDSSVDIPTWAGPEITGVRWFSNASLSKYLNEPASHRDIYHQTVGGLWVGLHHNPDDILTVPFYTLLDVTSPVEESKRAIALLLSRIDGVGLLNDAEVNWLATDKTVTIFELMLMVSYILRKHR
jgi:adenylate cyclase